MRINYNLKTNTYLLKNIFSKNMSLHNSKRNEHSDNSPEIEPYDFTTIPDYHCTYCGIQVKKNALHNVWIVKNGFAMENKMTPNPILFLIYSKWSTQELDLIKMNKRNFTDKIGIYGKTRVWKLILQKNILICCQFLAFCFQILILL